MMLVILPLFLNICTIERVKNRAIGNFTHTKLHSVVVVRVGEIASFRSATVAMTCGLSLKATWHHNYNPLNDNHYQGDFEYFI